MTGYRFAALAGLVALALSACDQPEQGQSGQGAETPSAKSGAFQMQPGKYRTTVGVEQLEIADMPPAAADQLKAMMGEAAAETSCLTPERAARGVDVIKEQIARGKCRFDRFDAQGGKLDASFSCQTGDRMEMRATSSGTYSNTGLSVRVDGKLTGPGGRSMHIVQTIETARVGECT